MANVKVAVSRAQLNAAKTYNTTTRYEGINNIYDMLKAYANVNLVLDREVVKNCDRNIAEKQQNTFISKVNVNVWGFVVNDLLTNFDMNINAQILLPMFVDANYLDFSQFNLTDIYEDSVDGGDLPPLLISPSISKNFFELGGNGLSRGLYGYTANGVQISKTVETNIRASFDSVFNGATMVYDVYDNANNVVDSDASGTIADGVYSVNVTANAGDYSDGVFVLKSFIAFDAATNDALRYDLNLANMNGVDRVFSIGFS